MLKEEQRKNGTLKLRKQGARKIRFEMPFHVRCVSCSQMIAKGVRFNAVKKKCGRYLGTLIFQFSMTCPNCKKPIVIKTDPKSTEYCLITGVIKYNVDYNEELIEVNKVQKEEEAIKLNSNAFYKIENNVRDIKRGERLKPNIERLIEMNEEKESDFYLNKKMRNIWKEERQEEKIDEDRRKLLGMDIKIDKVNIEDIRKAKNVNFSIIDGNRYIRDKWRFGSIFEECDNTKIRELLNKKRWLDVNWQKRWLSRNNYDNSDDDDDSEFNICKFKKCFEIDKTKKIIWKNKIK